MVVIFRDSFCGLLNNSYFCLVNQKDHKCLLDLFLEAHLRHV